MILTLAEMPMMVYPTNSRAYQSDLEDYLRGLIVKEWKYTGSITKTVAKNSYTVYTFTHDKTLEDVLVLDSSLAGINNFPSSDASLARDANAKFDSLGREGWIYSGSFFKKISTSNFTYLVFYRHKKAKR